MKKAFLISVLTASFGLAAWAQNADQLPVNDPNAVALDDFPGCQVAPPKNGCSARISCVGEADILFVDSRGIREATKVASLDARKRLSQFFNDKVKAKEAMAAATKTVAKQGPEGDSATREMARTTAEVTSSSTESLLQGVVTLGRLVSKADRLVQIKIGQSCKSKAAAAQGAAVTSAAPAQAQAAPKLGGPKVFGNSGMRSVQQRAKNADDF